MKMTVEVDCTPEEARAFLGLPDISGVNQYLVDEMQKRIDQNVSALQPDELMKNWMAFGGQATDHFRKLMTAAAGAAMSGTGPSPKAGPPHKE